MLLASGKHFGKGAGPGCVADGCGREAGLAGAGCWGGWHTRFATRSVHWIFTVQLLEEDLATLAPQMREQLTPRLEIIHGELHRLEGIVERFLRLAGPAGVDLEPVEIRKILTHVCELLRPEAAARGIEIASRVEDSLPPVMADPVRLTQALLNVVINAIQAVDRKGRVEVIAQCNGRVGQRRRERRRAGHSAGEAGIHL